MVDRRAYWIWTVSYTHLWCPYLSVCGHEPDGAAQEMAKWDRDAVLEELGKSMDGREEDCGT